MDSSDASVLYGNTTTDNQPSASMRPQNNCRKIDNSTSAGHSCVKTIVPRTKPSIRYHPCRNHRNTFKRLMPLLSMSLCLVVIILSASSPDGAHRTQAEAAELSTGAGVASRVASKLQTGGARLARKLELAKSSGQINDWLVHQVAPAMANKLINNVLQAPKSPIKSSTSSGDSSSKKSAIDTQALADKIVDKLADSIKKRKKQANASHSAATASASAEEMQVADHEGPTPGEEPVKAEPAKSKGSNRKGKSLVSDSVHQVVQNLFSKDQRTLFGRTIEKSKFPMRHNSGHQAHNSSNNWLMVKEPVYDQNLFVSTDSSKLDENPVVLRAEHGHNLTTTDSTIQHDQPYNGGQNLSPLISSLMSNPSTNQIGNKLLQKHRLQQKYVHTNRHNQQQLSPKPWPAPNPHNRRQQQSPYSLPVTSDMNIVQAPSSPAPPPVSSTSTTTTTTTTTLSPVATNAPTSFSYPPAELVIQLGANKFKINNRHQFPSSTVPISASSWYSSNRNHQQPQNTYSHANNNHRYQHHHPSTTSTSTTTTTTTTTTTPEPPTDPPMTESMESDIDQQTSAPVSQILSSVAQSALESLTQSGSQNSDESTIYNNFSNSSYGAQTPPTAAPSNRGHSSGESLKAIKGASPSTTTARQSVISAEAIPTALGAPLYHLTRANFTVTSIMAPPPRRTGPSPAAKLAAQYFQKGLNNLSSNIFGRQSKNWARKLGLSSVLLSGLLYGAAILANPGAPLPTNGFEGEYSAW